MSKAILLKKTINNYSEVFTYAISLDHYKIPESKEDRITFLKELGVINTFGSDFDIEFVEPKLLIKIK